MEEEQTNNEEENDLENENYELERVRWEGEVSSPVGKTPFGFFDNDSEFVSFAPRAAIGRSED